jgi:hypothetical protein
MLTHHENEMTKHEKFIQEHEQAMSSKADSSILEDLHKRSGIEHEKMRALHEDSFARHKKLMSIVDQIEALAKDTKETE